MAAERSARSEPQVPTPPGEEDKVHRISVPDSWPSVFTFTVVPGGVRRALLERTKTMVKDSARKNAIRARMAQTGKSYTDAARELDREAAEAARRRGQQPVITFEWFSGLAHEVVNRAREHARSHGHGAVGTEHLLLGLIDDRAGDLAFEILDDLAGAVEAVESAVAAAMPPGVTTAPEDIPWSEHAAFVLVKGADRQRNKIGHGYIGSEHILLALLAHGDSRACQVLTDLGITYKLVRTEVVGRLNAMGVVSRYNQPTHWG